MWWWPNAHCYYRVSEREVFGLVEYAVEIALCEGKSKVGDSFRWLDDLIVEAADIEAVLVLGADIAALNWAGIVSMLFNDKLYLSSGGKLCL